MNLLKPAMHIKPVVVDGEVKWAVVKQNMIQAFFDDWKSAGFSIAGYNFFRMLVPEQDVEEELACALEAFLDINDPVAEYGIGMRCVSLAVQAGFTAGFIPMDENYMVAIIKLPEGDITFAVPMFSSEVNSVAPVKQQQIIRDYVRGIHEKAA